MDELTLVVWRIKELEEEQAVITAELDDLKGKLRDYMKAEGVNKVRVDKYNVTYTEYTTNRFDSTRFKAEHEDMYSQYLKATQASRLSISLIKK